MYTQHDTHRISRHPGEVDLRDPHNTTSSYPAMQYGLIRLAIIGQPHTEGKRESIYLFHQLQQPSNNKAHIREKYLKIIKQTIFCSHRVVFFMKIVLTIYFHRFFCIFTIGGYFPSLWRYL
jgi:hypothetical protein